MTVCSTHGVPHGTPPCDCDVVTIARLEQPARDELWQRVADRVEMLGKWKDEVERLRELLSVCESYLHPFYMSLKLKGNEQMAEDVSDLIDRVRGEVEKK